MAEDTPSEFVFVLDRGKALAGRKMARVRAALLLWLHSLPPGCHFNIMAYGDAVTKLYAVSQPYYDATLRQAAAFVADLDAEGGAGALAAALAQAFAVPVDEGRTKQLFVLLADESGADRADDVLPVVAGGARTARVYAFALGLRANQALARRIAKVASGFYEFLPSDQFLEAAVVDRVVRSSGPSLTRVTLDWGVTVSAQTPAALPCIFSDNRNLFVGFASVPVSALAGDSVRATVHGRVAALTDGRHMALRDVAVHSAAARTATDDDDGDDDDDVVRLNGRARAVAALRWQWAAACADDSADAATAAAALRVRLLRDATDAGIHVPGVTELQLLNSATRKADAMARIIPRVEGPAAARARDVVVRHAAEPPPRPNTTATASATVATVAAPVATAKGTDKGKDEPQRKSGGLWSWLRGDDDKDNSGAKADAHSGDTMIKLPVSAPSGAVSAREGRTRAPTRLLAADSVADDGDREPFVRHAADLDALLALQRANGRWLMDAPLVAFLCDTLDVPRADVAAAPRKLRDDLRALPAPQPLDVWATALVVQVLLRVYPDAEPNWAGMCAKAKGAIFRAIKRCAPSDTPPASIAAEARGYLDMATKVLADLEGGRAGAAEQ